MSVPCGTELMRISWPKRGAHRGKGQGHSKVCQAGRLQSSQQAAPACGTCAPSAAIAVSVGSPKRSSAELCSDSNPDLQVCSSFVLTQPDHPRLQPQTSPRPSTISSGNISGITPELGALREQQVLSAPVHRPLTCLALPFPQITHPKLRDPKAAQSKTWAAPATFLSSDTGSASHKLKSISLWPRSRDCEHTHTEILMSPWDTHATPVLSPVNEW